VIRYLWPLILFLAACSTPAGIFLRGAAHLSCAVYDAVDPIKNPAADLRAAGLDGDAGTADR